MTPNPAFHPSVNVLPVLLDKGGSVFSFLVLCETQKVLFVWMLRRSLTSKICVSHKWISFKHAYV
jgi:hypothetical protein